MPDFSSLLADIELMNKPVLEVPLSVVARALSPVEAFRLDHTPAARAARETKRRSFSKAVSDLHTLAKAVGVETPGADAEPGAKPADHAAALKHARTLLHEAVQTGKMSVPEASRFEARLLQAEKAHHAATAGASMAKALNPAGLSAIADFRAKLSASAAAGKLTAEQAAAMESRLHGAGYL
jgi:hypothetical protein